MRELPPLVDIHNHLIPAVDDGARSVDEALAALAVMWEQGIRRIVTTPHLNAELTHSEDAFARRMQIVDEGWRLLESAAADRFSGLELARGYEIMLDVPRVNLADPRVRLMGGRFVLVEFPRLFVPAGATEALHHLWTEGWLPIVVHPERYLNVNLETGDPGIVAEWRRVGTRLAINAGSIMGGFGSGALATVRALLSAGWVDLIGSDFHARPDRRLFVRPCYERLCDWGGQEQAELLLSINPGRVMDGAEPLSVPALPFEGGFFGRIRQIFSR